MQRHQAFKYELMPSGEQQRQMRRFAGSCRFVFNKALAMRKALYEKGEKKRSYAGLSSNGGKWFVSIQTEREVEQPLHPATSIVGIEDLQIRNMSRSAAGSSEAPGRNVKAKSGLNKSILDQGWFEFRRQLQYKQAWRGGDVLAVPAHNTSRTCPACGHVSADNRQTQAWFACMDCGYENNADLVGAINVLNRGPKMLEGQDMADASARRQTAARIACEVNGAVMPSAAGTRRSESARFGLNAVGIPVL